MLERVASPVLVSVMTCGLELVPVAWLAKVNEDGDRVAWGAGAGVPCPVRETLCGLSAASSVMVIAAVLVPVLDGVKVTDSVQLAPADKVPAQPFVRL